MSYGHGITVNEKPTQLPPPSNLITALPVVFGTAPVNLTDNPKVNEPIIAYKYDDAVAALGYSDDFEQYTLCEFMKAYFELYKIGPAIFVNVLDPVTHKQSVAETEMNVVKGKAVVEQEGIIAGSVVVKNNTTNLIKDTDYILSFDYRGYLIVTAITGGAMADLVSVRVSFDKLDPSLVEDSEIIGSIDPVTGKKKGLEIIGDIFPKFRMNPCCVVAPKYSASPVVAGLMAKKIELVNSHFKGIAISDITTNTVNKYTDVGQWKEENAILEINQIACWPKVSYRGQRYHLSTHIAAIIAQTDLYRGNGVPYISPSNKELKIDSAVLSDGTEILLGPDEANILNAKGVTTALNFVGGWKSWGNRTAYYQEAGKYLDKPVEPKDTFIPVRRMFDWLNNRIIMDCWKDVDDPMNPRLVDNFINKINIWFNGLTAQGAILGGRIEIFKEDNPVDSMMNGKLRFRIYVTPPSPAEEIIFDVEYDPSYMGNMLG